MKGLGILDVVTIVLVTLKLTGNIDLAWKWVLAPTWIPLAIICGVWLVASGVFVAFGVSLRSIRKSRFS